MNLRLLYEQNKEKTLTLLDQAVQSGSNFTLAFLFSKYLGLTIYGEFALFWMFILFTSSLQQALIYSPMIYLYFTKKTSEERKDYLNSVFWCNCILAVISIPCLLICLKHFININLETLDHPYIAMAFTIGVYLTYDFVRRKLILEGKVLTTLILDIISSCCQISTSLFLLHSTNLKSDTILFIISGCLFIPMIFGLRNQTFTLKYIDLKMTLLDHWHQGMWLGATSILQWFSGNYFIIMAGNLLGTKEIGIIRVAQNIIGLMNVFFIAIETYLPRQTAAIKHRFGDSHLLDYLKKFTIKGLIFTTIVSCILALSAKNLLGFLYGDVYTPYIYVVQIYCLFNILIFVTIPLKLAVRSLEYQHQIFVAYVISMLFSLVSANLLIFHYGIVGTLIGIFSTQIIIQIWYLYSLKKDLYAHNTFGVRKS